MQGQRSWVAQRRRVRWESNVCGSRTWKAEFAGLGCEQTTYLKSIGATCQRCQLCQCWLVLRRTGVTVSGWSISSLNERKRLVVPPNTSAIRRRVGSVGNSLLRSSFESITAERPVYLPYSTRPMLFRSRRAGALRQLSYSPRLLPVFLLVQDSAGLVTATHTNCGILSIFVLR